MSDLERLVGRTLGWQDAILDPSRALNCRVRVQLDHGRPGRHRFRAVDLDLEVALRSRPVGHERECCRDEESEAHGE